MTYGSVSWPSSLTLNGWKPSWICLRSPNRLFTNPCTVLCPCRLSASSDFTSWRSVICIYKCPAAAIPKFLIAAWPTWRATRIEFFSDIFYIYNFIRHIGSHSRNRKINNINQANHSQHSQKYTTYTRVCCIILTLWTYYYTITQIKCIIIILHYISLLHDNNNNNNNSICVAP